jgi:hypothetical protein
MRGENRLLVSSCTPVLMYQRGSTGTESHGFGTGDVYEDLSANSRFA